jgi:ribose 5-phosphate isomerase A
MYQDLSPSNRAKFACAKRAADFVKSGMKVGLGTGSTAAFLVKILGERVRTEGLRFQGVPTSTRTADLAREEGIEVITLEQAGTLDVTIDGADEFDPKLNLIKGGGGAHLQEKIVATASKEMVVIADASKDVATLGQFPLPVEVIPFGHGATRTLVEAVLKELGYRDPQVAFRADGDAYFKTDEGNYILDLKLQAISDAPRLSQKLNQIAGVVENGLFLNICSSVVVGFEDGRTVTKDKSGRSHEVNVFDQGESDNLFSDIED